MEIEEFKAAKSIAFQKRDTGVWEVRGLELLIQFLDAQLQAIDSAVGGLEKDTRRSIVSK